MYKNILLPIDLSEGSSWKKALPTAIGYCEVFKSNLFVLNVVPDFGMSIVSNFFPDNFEQKALDGANEVLHAFVKNNIPSHISVKHIIGHGNVYTEIIETSEEVNADLIIMSSHRPELRDYLLGPNAARVVRHSTRSVLVVRD